MLSRGKLVQDWRRRLAAAEAEDQEEQRLRWLYRMRVRLYQFLLSCYRQGDWRADEPGAKADDTLADIVHGDTTTILDAPLNGKPAKNAGQMRAVLKSVSAAQDYPAEAGPLLGGIAADDWVVAVSVRDKLKMAACMELLRQNGIASTWTVMGEIKVRHFDLARTTELIRRHRPLLRIKPTRSLSWLPPIIHPASIPLMNWPVRLALVIFFFAPIGAACGLPFIQVVFTCFRLPLMSGPEVVFWFAILYVVVGLINVLSMLLQDIFRRQSERREVQNLLAAEKE